MEARVVTVNALVHLGYHHLSCITHKLGFQILNCISLKLEFEHKTLNFINPKMSLNETSKVYKCFE